MPTWGCPGPPGGVPKVGGSVSVSPSPPPPPPTHMLCRTWARATPLARSWGVAQGEGGSKVCSWGGHGTQRGGGGVKARPPPKQPPPAPLRAENGQLVSSPPTKAVPPLPCSQGIPQTCRTPPDLYGGVSAPPCSLNRVRPPPHRAAVTPVGRPRHVSGGQRALGGGVTGPGGVTEARGVSQRPGGVPGGPRGGSRPPLTQVSSGPHESRPAAMAAIAGPVRQGHRAAPRAASPAGHAPSGHAPYGHFWCQSSQAIERRPERPPPPPSWVPGSASPGAAADSAPRHRPGPPRRRPAAARCGGREGAGPGGGGGVGPRRGRAGLPAPPR